MNQGEGYIEYIEDIAFYRDILNDLPEDEEIQKTCNLEKMALELFIEASDPHSYLKRINLAVIGDFNAGKSSFINSLLNKEVCPVGACPKTSSITKFLYSDNPRITLEGEKREITPNEYENLVCQRTDYMGRIEVTYYYPFDGFRDIALYDTPGFDNPENPYDTEITNQILNDADVIFFIQDINKSEVGHKRIQDIKDMRKAKESIKIYLIFNKSDNRSLKERNALLTEYQKKYAELFDGYFTYSADKAIIQEAETGIEGLLSDLTDELMPHLISREDFEVQVLGKVTRGKWQVQVDDRICLEKPSAGSYQKEKELIVSLLENIRNEKENYIAQRFNEKRSTYRMKRTKQLNALKKYLMQNGKQTVKRLPKNLERLVDDVVTLCKNYRHSLQRRVMNLCNASVNVFEVPKEKKSYYFNPYYGLALSGNFDSWMELVSELDDDCVAIFGGTQIAVGEKFEYNIDSLSKDFTRIRNDLRKSIQKKEFFSNKTEATKDGALLSESITQELVNVVDSWFLDLETNVKTKCAHIAGKHEEMSKQEQIERELLMEKVDQHLQVLEARK